MGQGNGAGPSVWSILSSTIFDELHRKGHSTPFCFALSQGLFQLCGFSYVDDCDLIADGDNADTVHSKLQLMLTVWDKLMEVTGAAIAPDKCWWYLVDFVWSGGLWHYRDAGKDKILRVRDKDGIFNRLEYQGFKTSMEMVGVLLAPNGNQTEQLQRLRKKATTWAGHINTSPLDDVSVWLALNQTILRGVEYPLAATTLSQRQLDAVMSPILQCALPRAGFVRSFPHAVLYGPVALQGLGVTNPFLHQFTRHIQDIVDQTWRKTPVGELIIANLEAAKLEAGLFWSLFDQPIEITWFNTTNAWIIETYRFCQTHQILFDEPGDRLIPECTGDKALMEIFATTFEPPELIRLNRCRLFCKVVAASDVTTGDGQHLLPEYVTLQPQYEDEKGRHWPEQGTPTRTDWDLWAAALREGLAGSTYALQTPLGDWTITEAEYMINWKWYISDREVLYKRLNANRWQRFNKIGHRGSRRPRYNTEHRRVRKIVIRYFFGIPPFYFVLP